MKYVLFTLVSICFSVNVLASDISLEQRVDKVEKLLKLLISKKEVAECSIQSKPDISGVGLTENDAFHAMMATCKSQAEEDLNLHSICKDINLTGRNFKCKQIAIEQYLSN